MSDAFIVRCGGGPAFAGISVNYPEGSLCTCSNGSRTIRAGDTSGAYLFRIPALGTWTVSCTDGTQTVSQSVVIDRHQLQSIELNYSRVLYDAGNEFVALTGGWAVLNGGGGRGEKQADKIDLTYTGSSGRDSSAVTNNKITKGAYTVLKALITVSAASNGVNVGMTQNSRAFPDVWNAVVNTKTLGEQTVAVDISNVNIDAYVAVHADVSKASVHKVWME